MFLLGPILGLLGGPLGKVFAGVAAGGAILLGAALWLHEHDARVLAEQAARQQAVVAAAQLADAKAATAAVQAVADAAEKRAEALANVRMEIAHATAPSASCAVPAAVLRAVDAMRPAP
ncbi:MAG: hypothetical protein KGN77_01925 [Xanthomonadaceae bacterium]|nr:hypothetical protein [Xanthomonadaceae bacterium]